MGGGNFVAGELNSGGRYSPSTGSWTAITIANAPLGRSGHTALWTGSEMIVWGGRSYPTGDSNSGGRYNPATDTWTASSMVNSPDARSDHTAAWSGSEMIIWGGAGCQFGNCILNTGGRYSPSTDSWTATSTIDAPAARWEPTGLWTGREMIVWGGSDNTNGLHTGGRYNPSADSWTPTAVANVPLGRYAHSAVWTGSEMIVWGGVDETFNATNSGGRYNPARIAGCQQASPAHRCREPITRRCGPGREMILWGGNSPAGDFNTGERYDPATDSWTPMTTANAPFARAIATAVWTGNEMIVWDGLSSNAGVLNTGGRYCAQPATPIMQSVASRKTHGNAGSWDVNLPLSGTPGIECRSGGVTGEYTIVVTFFANVSVTGSPQAAVTSGIGTIGSGGVSNGAMIMTSGNVVTIPLTNVANAQTITVTLNNVNGSTNLTIPMSLLLGDVNSNRAVNASDVGLTKALSGQPINSITFRSDVNADGSILAADVSLIKSKSGTVLP